MPGNLLTLAAAALRGPGGPSGLAFGGVRALTPVVRSLPGAVPQPAPQRSNALDRTRYTPGTANGPATSPGNDLYNRTGGINTAGYQAVSQSLSYARNDTFDLSIETADGDLATIRISQQQRFDASFGAASATSGGGRASALELSVNSSDNLAVSLSVQGELSAEETASITALVNKVNDVADDFFAGDIRQATQAASQISFGPDDDSLSGYSFSLQSQESLRAVAVYESVAAATSNAAEQSPGNLSAPAIALAPAPRPPPAAQSDASEPQPKVDFLKSLRAMLDDLARSAKALTA